MTACALAFVAGCATVSTRPAPVTERTPPPKQAAGKPAVAVAPAPAPGASKPAPQTAPDARRDVYTVKQGDTLYSIASEHGVDYRELALWNGLESPGAVRAGQQLRMTPPPGSAVAVPLRTPGGVDARPLTGAAPTSPSPSPIPAPSTPAPRCRVRQPAWSYPSRRRCVHRIRIKCSRSLRRAMRRRAHLVLKCVRSRAAN